jgi:hypothetical protein
MGADSLDGQYVLDKVLGKGSFGTACLMTRVFDGKQVVVKSIDVAKMKERDAEFARQEAKVGSPTHWLSLEECKNKISTI